MTARRSCPNRRAAVILAERLAWQLPDFENADTFVEHLVRRDVLVRDPLVTAVIQERAPGVPRPARYATASCVPPG